MGALQAMEFAAAVSDSSIDLEPALQWHLTANHWPPLPIEYVGILAAVIRDMNSGLIDETDGVTLPRGLRIVPGKAKVNEEGDLVILTSDLLDATNCWFFVED
jgi:hypothetical protein